MGRYVVSRALATVPVVVLVTVLLFALRTLTPGDAATVAIGQEPDLSRTEYAHTLHHLRQQYDLDKPLPVQYLLWVGHALTGDLGRAYRSHQPVRDEIAQRLPVTAEIGLLSLTLSWLIAIPAGVIAAQRRNSAADVIARLVGLFGLSLPSIFTSFALIYLLAVRAHWFPPSGWVPLTQSLGGNLKAVALPVITLGTASAAGLMRLTRSSLLEVLGQDYLRTAQAKGLRERSVIWRHAMRNAAGPIVTLIGLEFGGLLGGAFITETIFALPGMGKLAVAAIYAREYPTVQGVLLVTTLTYLLANFAVDLLYGVLDPRIRYE
jgi:peptide/nickel transport system permease protein